MAFLRDIAKNLGVIPRFLAKRDEKQSNALSKLMGENEALRSQMAGQAGQAGQAEAPAGMKKGGMVGSASKRADGCAVRGKTKGRIV